MDGDLEARDVAVPHYSDYHRTVVGYHGTRLSVAREIIGDDRAFVPSENNDDWLGHGIYFWEYAPQQAFVWAKNRSTSKKWDEEIAVLGSMIRLGNCFDLLDPENVKELSQYHKTYQSTVGISDKKSPVNVKSRKRLNCSVFEFAYTAIEASYGAIDTCRAVFLPSSDSNRGGRNGKMLWTGCGINPRAHIQICVRKSSCILGTWLVRPSED